MQTNVAFFWKQERKQAICSLFSHPLPTGGVKAKLVHAMPSDRSEWWLLLWGDTDSKSAWRKLMWFQNYSLSWPWWRYMGVEKSKKFIKLYNENKYTLYAFLCVGYLSLKKKRKEIGVEFLWHQEVFLPEIQKCQNPASLVAVTCIWGFKEAQHQKRQQNWNQVPFCS